MPEMFSYAVMSDLSRKERFVDLVCKRLEQTPWNDFITLTEDERHIASLAVFETLTIIRDRNQKVLELLGLHRDDLTSSTEKQENSSSIALWAEETFGRATALSTAIRAQMELTELISKLQRLAQGKRGEGEQVVLRQDVEEVMGEVADVRIVLARIQRFFHNAPTAEQAEDAKMVINRARKWKLDGHGHGQHVEETPRPHPSPDARKG